MEISTSQWTSREEGRKLDPRAQALCQSFAPAPCDGQDMIQVEGVFPHTFVLRENAAEPT